MNDPVWLFIIILIGLPVIFSALFFLIGGQKEAQNIIDTINKNGFYEYGNAKIIGKIVKKKFEE